MRRGRNFGPRTPSLLSLLLLKVNLATSLSSCHWPTEASSKACLSVLRSKPTSALVILDATHVLRASTSDDCHITLSLSASVRSSCERGIHSTRPLRPDLLFPSISPQDHSQRGHATSPPPVSALTSVPSHYTCTFSYGNSHGVDRPSIIINPSRFAVHSQNKTASQGSCSIE